MFCDSARLMHEILMGSSALGIGAFSAFPLLAVLKFVFVSGVSRKGQFFGRIGEQRHGVFHLRGGVPHE